MLANGRKKSEYRTRWMTEMNARGEGEISRSERPADDDYYRELLFTPIHSRIRLTRIAACSDDAYKS